MKSDRLRRIDDLVGLFVLELDAHHHPCFGDTLGDPIDTQLYYILDDQSPTPRYLTTRGSSQLENFWKQLEIVFTGSNMSPEMVDAAVTEFVFR
jgi:hypothetical protein